MTRTSNLHPLTLTHLSPHHNPSQPLQWHITTHPHLIYGNDVPYLVLSPDKHQTNYSIHPDQIHLDSADAEEALDMYFKHVKAVRRLPSGVKRFISDTEEVEKCLFAQTFTFRLVGGEERTVGVHEMTGWVLRLLDDGID